MGLSLRPMLVIAFHSLPPFLPYRRVQWNAERVVRRSAMGLTEEYRVFVQERKRMQDLLNEHQSALAEVARLRHREAQLTADHAAVSSELSRVQHHMARMLASLIPAKSSHGRSATGGPEGVEKGGAVELRDVWSLPPAPMLLRRCAGPSISSGENLACLSVGSREEVLEQAGKSRPRGGVARESEGQVLMDRPSVFDGSAGQSMVKHSSVIACMHEDRPQFEILLHNLKSGL
jgi:hypothetical protein